MNNNEVKGAKEKRKEFMDKINEMYPPKDFSGAANEEELRYLQIRNQNNVIHSEIPGNDR